MVDLTVVSDIIRIKYNNNSATLEELSEHYGLALTTIKLIVENAICPSDEFNETRYDDRERKCGQCGSGLSEDGVPLNCTGECDYTGDEEFTVGGGDPEELYFE